MYSGESLDRIVRHYREPVKPIKVAELDDVKMPPNDILMSYLVELGMERQQLSALLGDFDELNSWLEACVPQPPKEPESLPMLNAGVTYDMPLHRVSAAIEVYSDKFAQGKDNRLLLAEKSARVHTYPSGTQEEYFLLTGERSANTSIFEGGYGTFKSGHIYVRQNSITMLLALMDAVRQMPEFAPYQEQMEALEEQAAGMVIAHEKSEIEIKNSGELPEDTLEAEIAADQKALVFLEARGVDVKTYELFHMLRANAKIKGNVSNAVLASSSLLQ